MVFLILNRIGTAFSMQFQVFIVGLVWGCAGMLLDATETVGLVQPNLQFTHLSPGQALTPGSVNAMLQDRQGMLWIGTETGLSGFDGYETITFQHNPNNGTSLGGGSVTALAEEPGGRLWVGTRQGFLERLDVEKRVFEHVVLKVKDSGETVDRIGAIQALLMVDSRWLWIGAANGLFRVDLRLMETERFDDIKGGISAIVESPDERVWIATEEGKLHVCCSKKGEETPKAIWAAPSDVRSLAFDKWGVLWVVTSRDGLLTLQPEGEGIREASDDSRMGRAIMEPTAVVPDSLGSVWLGSSEGLHRYEPESGAWSRYSHDPFDTGSVMGNRVTCVYMDKRRVLWLGFSSGGVSRFGLDRTWFDRMTIGSGRRDGLSHRNVTAALADRHGQIWFGTSEGLDRWDPVKGTIGNRFIAELNSDERLIVDVSALFEDSKGRLWVGKRGGGAVLLDISVLGNEKILAEACVGTREFSRYTITDFIENTDGMVWASTDGGGIFSYDEGGTGFLPVPIGELGEMGNLVINDLCRDSRGEIWVATSGDGLLKYDAANRVHAQQTLLPGGSVSTLFEDSDGMLWAGFYGRGLSRINLQTGEALTLSTRNSELPDDSVNSIAQDRSGRLWIATESGLARFDRATMEFRTFDRHDGLQGDRFNLRAACSTREGLVLFGGANGLSAINPNQIPDPREVQIPVLTALELFGEQVDPSPDGILKKPLSLTNLIQLPYSKNSQIGFRFATVNLAAPEKSQFRFRMDGVDADWQKADERRRASYAGLQPGLYTFEVQASIDGTNWNAGNAKVEVKIRPQWYSLWYTRVAFVVIATLLIAYWVVLRFRAREEKLRRQQEQLQVRYSRAEAALARQLQHAMLLEQTGLALGSKEGAGNLLGTALRNLGEAFGVGRSSVHAGTEGAEDSEAAGFHRVAEHREGDPAVDPDPHRRVENERFIRKLVRSERALAISDIDGRPDLFPSTVAAGPDEVRAVLAVRTSYLGHTNGFIILQHIGSGREWQSDEVKLIESLSGQFGMVIAQMEQQERDERQRRELEHAKREAELANRSKSDFLAKMTHELRTPLNAIIGFSELLSSDVDLTGRQRETLDIINNSGEHLLGVINDILEVSKIEAGKVELQPERFNLAHLLASVYEMLAFGVRAKGLSFEIRKLGDLPVNIVADKGKLRQVLVNLVGNATKFTADGKVAVLLRSSAPHVVGDRTLRMLCFEVCDTGPGIAPEDLPRLFEKFSQTETGQKSRRGTGLGLAISKAFVEMMGGKVEVESRVGVGSVFRFTIVCEEAGALSGSEESEQAAIRPAHLAAGQIRRLADDHPEIRILIAEDQPANRLLASRILKAAGFTVCEAENGAEALEKWREFQPHLILMDEEMPVMRGKEATQKIRAEADGKGPIIVALTAFALDETRVAALASGCDDFLAKPFRIDDLLATIARHVPITLVNAPPVATAA
jgi:signal transduction histidine kinase/ligand-binding sensor domain-containing protein/CheY-like chemotaxis protein